MPIRLRASPKGLAAPLEEPAVLVAAVPVEAPAVGLPDVTGTPVGTKVPLGAAAAQDEMAAAAAVFEAGADATTVALPPKLQEAALRLVSS